VTQEFAKFREDKSREEDVNSQISIIEGLMTFLTYSLFLSFGAVAIKKAFVKVRSLDAAEIKAKIKNIRSHGKHPKDEAAEFETHAAAEIELRERKGSELSVQSPEKAVSSNPNPMHSGEHDATTQQPSSMVMV